MNQINIIMSRQLQYEQPAENNNSVFIIYVYILNIRNKTDTIKAGHWDDLQTAKI